MDSERRATRTRAPWVGLAVALVLVAAAILFPAVTGIDVHVRWFPPLHAEWMPRVGPGTLVAVVAGVLAVLYAIPLAERLRWRWLLAATFGAGLVWLLALALVDGLDGIGVILETPYEYLRTARTVTDVGALLTEYVSRIPADAPDKWPVHLAGHPPGAVLFFVALARMGLGSGLAAGLVVVVVAATTPVAMMVALRRLGAADAARRAAPFLVFGPAAIWSAVSADAMFAAVAAWGLCLLAFAATSPVWWTRGLWGVAAGLALGYCVMLSYGLPLLGVLALAVLWLGGRWTALPWAVGAALAVVLGFAVGGFVWWEAYPVLVERYYAGVASNRPYTYWVWANLAALAVSAGPLVGSAVASALGRARGSRPSPDRIVVVLCLAAAASILLADLSGMSKAEVERIWLPFVPWLLVGCALLPYRWRRWGLGVQVGFALVVQHLLSTGW